MQTLNFSIIFFVLVGAFFAVAAFLIGLWSILKAELLSAHLKKTYYQRWVDITTLDTIFGRVGPGTRNPSKFLSYLSSDLDNEDKKILRYKHSLKIYLRYMGTLIVASFVTFGLTLILSW
jgi:hypothetical protein